MDGQLIGVVVAVAVAAPSFVVVLIRDTMGRTIRLSRRRRELRRLFILLALSLLPAWYLAYFVVR